MSKRDGGSAFPRSGFYSEDGSASSDSTTQDGMTLRDYAEVHFTAAWIPLMWERYGHQDNGDLITEHEAQQHGRSQADAMIEARSQ